MPRLTGELQAEVENDETNWVTHDSLFNANDEAVVETASRAVRIRPIGNFIVHNPNGTIGMEFQYTGDLRLPNGQVFPNASTASRTPTSAAEWIVRNGPNNDDVLARYDSSNGNLYIKGSLLENQSSVTQSPSVAEFVIKFEDDSHFQTRFIIDAQGNLKMKRYVI